MSIRQGRRVGCIGAGATGKTTTATFVSEMTDLPLIKSASRTVYEDNDLTEAKVAQMSSEDKLKLQLAIFNKKIQIDQQYEYVADRTLLDHYAYCLAYCGSDMANETFLQFEETVRTLMLSTYSHLYFFPWGYWTPEESDGVRSEVLSWQSQIDALMVGYLVRWNLPAVWVPQTLGAEYRNEFVLADVRGDRAQDAREV